MADDLPISHEDLLALAVRKAWADRGLGPDDCVNTEQAAGILGDALFAVALAKAGWKMPDEWRKDGT